VISASQSTHTVSAVLVDALDNHVRSPTAVTEVKVTQTGHGYLLFWLRGHIAPPHPYATYFSTLQYVTRHAIKVSAQKVQRQIAGDTDMPMTMKLTAHPISSIDFNGGWSKCIALALGDRRAALAHCRGEEPRGGAHGLRRLRTGGRMGFSAR
jgi:hypothetical protein